MAHLYKTDSSPGSGYQCIGPLDGSRLGDRKQVTANLGSESLARRWSLVAKWEIQMDTDSQGTVLCSFPKDLVDLSELIWFRGQARIDE